ncbi:MAG: hypothetical protein IPP66_11750 [Anaerolineales bacterium]|nr:hypothetical protein [Anaerolineales bacterium]
MRVITAVIAITAGVLVLLGIFFGGVFDVIRLLVTDWTIIIAGMAVLVGVLNLVMVQWGKISTRQKGWGYSVLLVVSLLGAALYGSILGLDNSIMKFTVEAIIIPVEASLLAILAVTLVYASIRLLRRRTDMMSVIFLITLVLFLLAIMPTPLSLDPNVQFIQNSIIGFVGMISRGGARGLLIGVALGTLLTGLRVLFGIDRPYGGK